METRPEYGERFRLALPDGDIAGRRFARPGAPRIVFCHATGFCATAYRQMLAQLARRCDVAALDLRGHGRSNLPANPAELRSWAPIARDIGAALDTLGADDPRPFILAGHSFGAVSALLAARGRRDIEGLALIEPVIPPRILAFLAMTPVWPVFARRIPLVKSARSRREHWPDKGAVIASYSRKQLFSSWAKGALEDYLEDGLIAQDNGVRLACAPEWEAAVFAAQANLFWPALAAAPATVRILIADHPSSTVRRGTRARLHRQGVEMELASGVSHLIPFEQPALAAAFIDGAVAA